ncbi:MAG: type I 3-dehydroquinate dehydratase [Lachnospiraceae bacterium]
MEEEIWIKNREIGGKRPLVCVPVIGKTREEISKEITELAKENIDIIEWRMDWYEKSNSIENCLTLLEELSNICQDVILLCTFRSKSQGGEKELNPETYCKLLKAVAESEYADIIDVEVCNLQNAKEVIELLHQTTRCIIGSDHNFLKTPSVQIMAEKLMYMKRIGADIGKLAVMPQNKLEVLHLLEASIMLKEYYPDYPIITMSMGCMGMITRIAGTFSGSCVTFGAAQHASAPGQLPVAQLTTILDKIMESMEEWDEK